MFWVMPADQLQWTFMVRDLTFVVDALSVML